MRILFVGLCALASISVCAQNKYPTPNYLPPSPIAESFKQYGDVPVSYSTGVPDISIPLYTIQVGDFSLPITLRYHVKSVKPASSRTNVALGWTLDYGGMVSRSIFGKRDESLSNQVIPYSSTQYSGVASDQELTDIHKVNGSDSESDIYSYSAGGASGEFINNRLNSMPVQMSRKPVDILANYDNVNITTDQGAMFKFGYGKYHMVLNSSVDARSSWLLSQIALPSNRTIDFTYEDIARFVFNPNRRMLSIIQDEQDRFSFGIGDAIPMSMITDNGTPPPSPSWTYTSPTFPVSYDEKNIKEINFANGKVVFELSTDKKLITGVKIYSGSTLLKEYQFVLSSSTVMGEMKLLSKIVAKDRNSAVVNEYQFEYNSGSFVSADAGTDYWGYYNGQTLQAFPCDTYTYQPYNNFPASWTFTGYCQTKAASESFTKWHTLSKIIYPTKGETEFYYTLNQLNSSIQGDGLRIERIINRDALGNSTTRTYTYAVPTVSTIPQDKREFASTNYTIQVYFDNSSPHAFHYVVRSRSYTYDADVASRMGASLLSCRYNEVTETIGTATTNIGKNVYYYKHNKHDLDFPVWTDKGPQYGLFNYKNWDNDLLYKKEVYKAGATTPVNTTDYEYIYHYDPNTYKNSVVNKQTSYPPTSQWGNLDWRNREYLSAQPQISSFWLPHVFTFVNYNIVPGWVELRSQTSTEVTPAGTITSLTEFEYNGAKKYFPSRTITYKSDGSKVVVDKQYSYDFNTIEPYQTMAAKNIIAPAITETQSLINAGVTTPLMSTKTNYSNWGSNILKPVSIQSSTGINPLEDRILFDGYDSYGNPVQLRRASGVPESYLWDYTNLYPIAHVINAKQKDIFHTSFEDAEGNSTDNKTGRKSRTGGYSKILSNLTNGSYTLSYWQKSGGTWTLQTSQVTVSGSYTINLSGQVDEVRFYPANAQMTTRTYDLLTGMTGVCDVSNRITYYEYDSFGRLQHILDQDRNVIKKMEYKYQGQ